MPVVVVALMLLLPLSSPFGEATATATSADDGLRLDVSVEVDGSPVAVVVRGLASGSSELPPVALASRGDGLWEGIVQVPVVENILMGFEIIPGQGLTTLSEFHTLTELGVDAAVFSTGSPKTGFGDDDPLITPEGERWGWLGLAAGAAALTLLAFWVIGTARAKNGPPDVDAVGDTDASGEAEPEPVLDQIDD